ncbi:MAG: hypothetical protein HND52_13175 [Ignavibacteriae bacterium]|nr:hypothetical protein [Ignavibacteriota bacterium]NOG98904.1 hypothetical protein [Ignavibacteriota bacterium]
MPDYIIAYHGGTKPASPEEVAKQMEDWKTWLAGLGDAVVNPGTPLGMSKTITSAGVKDSDNKNRLTGHSTVKAESLDAAIEMAKTCPFLEIGTLEVAEVMKM